MDCRFCENLRNPMDKIKHCEIIGFSFDFYASVDKDHICDIYEGVKSKNDCLREHDYKKFITKGGILNEKIRQ